MLFHSYWHNRRSLIGLGVCGLLLLGSARRTMADNPCPGIGNPIDTRDMYSCITSYCPIVTLYIDAGHGHHTATSCAGLRVGTEGSYYCPYDFNSTSHSVSERDLNLCVQHKLLEKIYASSCATAMWARVTDDICITPSQRVTQANAAAVDIYVAIHHNGEDSHTINRSESLFSSYNPSHTNSGSSINMGNAFSSQIATTFGISDGGRHDKLASVTVLSDVNSDILYGEASYLSYAGDNANWPEICQFLSPSLARVDLEADAFIDALNVSRPLICIPVVEGSFSATGEPDRVRLRWSVSDPNPVEFFVLSRSDNCFGPFSELAVVHVSGQQSEYEFEDLTVAATQTYYYALIDAGIEVERTYYATAVPTNLGQTLRPGSPSAWAAGVPVTSGGGIQVNWWAVPSATTYYVYRSLGISFPECLPEAAAWRPILMAQSSANSFVDLTAEPGFVYTYRVQAANSHGTSDLSAECTATAPVSVGVGLDRADRGELSLRVQARTIGVDFVIYSPKRQRIRVEILDVLGRKVDALSVESQSMGETRVSWPANHRSSGVSSGLYIVRVSNGVSVASQKFVIIK